MLAGSSRAISYSNEKRLKEVDILAKEVEGFFVVVNLLWTLWSLSQGISSKIDFGYWVSTYFRYTLILQSKHPSLIGTAPDPLII